MSKIGDRLRQIRHAWNVFSRIENGEERMEQFSYGNASFDLRPHSPRMSFQNDRSIISSIFTRMAIDVASANLRHVRLDDEDRYTEEIDSGLNDCLKTEANLDQAATALLLDIAFTMFDKGVAALVPVDTTLNPLVTGGFDINTMRVGEIVNFHPRHVRVSLYNEKKGIREEITLPKKIVAIAENPFYSVMNSSNSMLKRLTHKLSLLDIADEATASGKIDIIIQLPYTIKSEAKRTAASQRTKDIEMQLKGSQYGIAYADSTEKITQLNRPMENNLLKQIEWLVPQVYGQLGITEDIMKGTADESAMLNYHNRTIEPVLTAIVEAMRRTFLTKTARKQKQSIMAFHDPFKFVPMEKLADIADKFTRNKILSANEMRQVVGRKPSKDPEADKLVNANMPAPSEPVPQPVQEGDSQNGSRLQRLGNQG
jgi:hypothetical protein